MSGPSIVKLPAVPGFAMEQRYFPCGSDESGFIWVYLGINLVYLGIDWAKYHHSPYLGISEYRLIGSLDTQTTTTPPKFHMESVAKFSPR